MGIEKLTVDSAISHIIVLLGCLCPGFLILFLYFPKIIKGLDSILVLVFATSLTLPVLLVYSFLFALLPGGIELGTIEDKLNETGNMSKLDIQIELANARKSKLYESLFGGGIITCITVYISLVVCWFFRLTFTVFIGIQLGLLLLFIIGLKVSHNVNEGEKKENIGDT